MIVTVNDNAVVMKEGALLSDLPDLQGKDGKGMAVALNGRLVKRDAWDITQLKDTDSILIINAAFGG